MVIVFPSVVVFKVVNYFVTFLHAERKLARSSGGLDVSFPSASTIAFQYTSMAIG